MSLSIGGLLPSRLLSGLGLTPPAPPSLRSAFPDGMRSMTMQTASQVFPSVNFQSAGPPAGALPGGPGLQLPLSGGQTLTLPGPPVPGGGPAAQGPAGGMPSMPSMPSAPAGPPGAAVAATAPGQLLGNAADAVRNLLPSAPPPGPPAQAATAAMPSTTGPAPPSALAQATALAGRAVPAATAAAPALAGAAPTPVAAPASAAMPPATAGVQSPAGLQGPAQPPTLAAPLPSAAAPAATTAAAASTPTAPVATTPPVPAGPGLQAGRGEAVSAAPPPAMDRAVAPPAPATQALAQATPAGPGLAAVPLAVAALQAPAGTAVANAVAPAGNPQATAPVAGDLGGPSRAELIATGVYTAEGPGLRRRQRLRIGPEAIGAWLLALRQGQPLLVRPYDDTPREIARAMQWVFWTLALVAYGCLAAVLATFLLASGEPIVAPTLRRWSGELALVGLAAAAGAWWFARALTRPARRGPMSED